MSRREPVQGDLAEAGRRVGAATDAAELTPIPGANLRRSSTRRGLSLERLARASGVSRAMLGPIELGQSTPTINVVWKIARSLSVRSPR
jgi:DNA-binding XRE family transcriptional regulator